ncbi:unnamed protein product [Adineta steineri]|uniref:Innexin n=1 Tax=Adineta steineri TaxID=433720 RepID=A0A813YGP1_9BILA|nr:unnamed protein product [Adineta steineri]CAF1041965.1 unnamed protein product [Adineta steineri]
MDILEFVKKLSAGKHHSARNDDVFIDRLNHRYTVTMILVFAAVVTTQQYFGSPITCWVPAQFTGGYEKYANDICWIMNTYYVPMESDIPHAETTRYERMLKYYQWSPFILMFMALCFYFPRMLWRSLNNKSGLDIEKLVDEAMKHEQQEEDKKDDKKDDKKEEKKEEKTEEKKKDSEENSNEDSKKKPKDKPKKAVKDIGDMIIAYAENRYTSPDLPSRESKRFPQKVVYYLTFWRRRHLSSYIVLLFTFVKLLFLVNSLVQIYLLNAFLGNDYHLFGFEVIDKFVRGLDWGESKRFPRVTLCDFHIREVGIIHRYTVQCVLPINLFNEKIFLILWFWILLLAAFNIGDFLSWLLRMINVESRTSYIKRKLHMSNAMTPDNERTKSEENKNNDQKIKQFTREFLQEDGCFALRLLARNGQDIIVSDVIDYLFKYYCKKYIDGDTENDQSNDHPSKSVSPNSYHHINTDRSIDHSNTDRLLDHSNRSVPSNSHRFPRQPYTTNRLSSMERSNNYDDDQSNLV